jgi:hypothetical protein
MSERTLPEGIEEDSLHPASLQRGVWARRVFVAVLVVFIALALVNVFGQSMTTSEAASMRQRWW